MEKPIIHMEDIVNELLHINPTAKAQYESIANRKASEHYQKMAEEFEKMVLDKDKIKGPQDAQG